jgi:hypothetical protein
VEPIDKLDVIFLVPSSFAGLLFLKALLTSGVPSLRPDQVRGGMAFGHLGITDFF